MDDVEKAICVNYICVWAESEKGDVGNGGIGGSSCNDVHRWRF